MSSAQTILAYITVYAGLLSVFSVIASLRYELAIPMARNDTEADNIVAVCLMLVGASTLLVVPVFVDE